MIGFRLEGTSKADLSGYVLTDPLVVTRFTAFLEQAKCDPDLLTKLSTHSYDDADINVKKWIAQHNQGRAIWRLKFFCFKARYPDYRIFYCIDSPSKRKTTVCILGIKRREDIDYDNEQHPTSRDIIGAFNRCCSRIYM